MARIPSVSVAIAEAVNVIFPFVAGGATATATGFAEAGGERVFDAATRLSGRLRHRLGDGEVTKEDLHRALEQGLTEGEVSEQDLKALVDLDRATRTSIGRIDADRVYVDTVINTQTFNG
jgi:hypothetical protein